MGLTAIFDIGKTNKKFFLFDEKYKQVEKSYVRFEEKEDMDGFPCDDLTAIENWVKSTLIEQLEIHGDKITAVNFSTYGASFVHIDKEGKPLTPLINYLKPYPQKLLDGFYEKYGDSNTIAKETASPQMGMLNSGMQLYWLKHSHPKIYKNVKWSLHLPQYLSYFLTGLPFSEFTSIGCHTGLWDYEKDDYHRWVYEEGIDENLAPVVTTDLSLNTTVLDHKLKIGVGVHDSSSALIPYLQAEKKPFLLVSTGTWSISLNPFNNETLQEEDLKNDCLNFLRLDGQPVKAARLFLGNEHSIQVKKLHHFFGSDKDSHKRILFDENIYQKLISQSKRYFQFDAFPSENSDAVISDLNDFTDLKTAYHQLLIELMDHQIACIIRAKGNTTVKKIYIDGGFTDSDLFVKLLALHFPNIKIRATKAPLGSALGAAMVISEKQIKKNFLKKNYGMNKIQAPISDYHITPKPSLIKAQ